MIDKNKCFLANPPPAKIDYKQLTSVQQWAIDLGADSKQKILYLCGKAGSGKTTVALKICERFGARVQAGACTGRAASNFNGPTVHTMFGWTQKDFQEASIATSISEKKLRI